MPASGDRKPTVGASGSRRKPSQSNTGSAAPVGPTATGPKAPSEYAPVNNFNSQDVTNHFHKSFTKLELLEQEFPDNKCNEDAPKS
ncbi:hypothetical protein BGZ82_005360 [Podila clonocystis]|nr:hypothetical protein BGZ82_005360 [Podila clonocystis]